MAFNRTSNPPRFKPVIIDSDPTIAPAASGATYVNPTTLDVYIATGTNSAADWLKITSPKSVAVANNLNLSGFKNFEWTITADDLQKGHIDLDFRADQIIYVARERVLYTEGNDWTAAFPGGKPKINFGSSMMYGHEALEVGDKLFIQVLSLASMDTRSFTITVEDVDNQYITVPHALSRVLYLSRERVLYLEGQDWRAEIFDNYTRIHFMGALASSGLESIESGDSVFIQLLV